MNKRRSEADLILDFKDLDSQNIELKENVIVLQKQNERFRTKNKKVKQHYKEFYDSIKIMCAKTIEKTSSLLTENEKLKAQLKRKISQELLEYVIGTCPKEFSTRDKKVTTTPFNRKKQVTFKETCETSTNNTQTHVEHQKVQKTNVPVIPSTGVNNSTEASGSKPRSNIKNNRILSAKSDYKKKVEDRPRNNKYNLKQENRVDSSISYKRTWKPTGNKFTLGEQCPLTRLTKSKVVQIVRWYLDSGCSKHMTRNRSRLKNFVKKFIRTVRFRNDHFGAIMGYGDYMIGDNVISKILKLHSENMRVMLHVDGVELLKGYHGSNLYTISVEDMMKSSPICLLSKASKNKSWSWHRRLNHLNFSTINDLAKKDLVTGLPRLKFEKDHLCSACQLGKSKKYTHIPKSENTIMEVLHALHIDLFTWVKFLRSKDETPEFVIKFLKKIQVGLYKTVRYIRTDNGTEFVNQVLTEFYESVDITHQKSVLRTPQQIMAQNHTLVEAAWTMVIFSKTPMFLWTEVVATTCYTQNSALCYPTNDSEDLGKLKAKADIGIFIGYAPNRKGYRIFKKRTRRIMETIHV
ncbi:retrovirus-related pol polyprotein from transposon TNT 1-94 [Tanacetum coccineum]|uniref:Retrovirus-related pol polyprotein from transposon TNT 1-94 n=1 Tax=Tanacetum coccineum TaxID=301880 RepID=A0ABQ5ETB3_9ASTR